MRNFTQKFIGLLALVFAMSFNTNAQTITADMFVSPPNTGANMTILFHNLFPYELEGAQAGAFFDLNGDGEYEIVGIYDVSVPTFNVAIWGDDSFTPEIDGLLAGQVPEFALLHNGEVFHIDYSIEFTGYVTNGIIALNDASQLDLIDSNGNSVFGCTDVTSCDYDSQMIYDDGSCVNYPELYYDCSGNCVNDSDGDGVCDENEVSGCMDTNFVEYNPLVTDAEENSCLTTWQEGYSIQSSELTDLQNLNNTLASELGDVSYQLDTLTNAYQTLMESPQCEEIVIDIQEGWNIFGYTSSQVLDIADVMAPFDDYIYIIKDNNGSQYWPANNYNGIGDFVPGGGYQIKAYQAFSTSFEN